MDKIKGSQLLMKNLEQYGVDTIFGLIGAHTMELFDALYDFQDSIRLITTRDERSAALMADGYGRVSHKPGVCLTSTGPGAANALSGLGEAYFSFSPVIHITSTAEENLYGRALGANHETRDQLGMLRSVSRQAFHLSTPADIPGVIKETFYNLAVNRPQPISIEIPADVQGETSYSQSNTTFSVSGKIDMYGWIKFSETKYITNGGEYDNCNGSYWVCRRIRWRPGAEFEDARFKDDSFSGKWSLSSFSGGFDLKKE